MFRNTYADLAMHFILFFLLFIYPINSLNDVALQNTTTAKSSKSIHTTRAPEKPHVLDEKDKTVIITTEKSTIDTTNEADLNFQESVLKLLNKPPVIGGTCKNNSDCNVGKNSVCIHGICQCETEYVASPNNNSCLLKATVLGDNCTENVQCDSIYGVSGLTVCASFHCVCSGNAVLINDRCYRKTLLGKSCTDDTECKSIKFSYCFQKVCACDPDFFPDDSGTQCLPFINGTSNITNINCKDSSSICKVLGEDAQCSNDTCVCYPGYHIIDKKCIKEKVLGDSCKVDLECAVDMFPEEKPGARVCKNNKCGCAVGYKELLDHNACQSGSSLTHYSFLLILGSLFSLLR